MIIFSPLRAGHCLVAPAQPKNTISSRVVAVLYFKYCLVPYITSRYSICIRALSAEGRPWRNWPRTNWHRLNWHWLNWHWLKRPTVFCISCAPSHSCPATPLPVDTATPLPVNTPERKVGGLIRLPMRVWSVACTRGLSLLMAKPRRKMQLQLQLQLQVYLYHAILLGKLTYGRSR